MHKRIIGATIAGLLIVSLAACGSSGNHDNVATAGGTATPSSSTSAGPQGEAQQEQQGLKYAQCMRDNGVPDFPDPQFNGNGGMSINAPTGADPAKMDAAQVKCKQYLPNGGEPTKIDPQTLGTLRKLSQCMRDHGVQNFPDPTDQGIQANGNDPGMDPNDPTFQAATKACDKYAPAPPSGAPSGGSPQNGSNG